MHSSASEGIQISGQRGDKRLALAGLHLGDRPAVQNNSADQLDIEVAHARRTKGRFSNNSEGLDQDLVEGVIDNLAQGLFLLLGGSAGQFCLGDAFLHVLAKLRRAFAKLLISEPLHLRFKRVYFTYYGPQPFQQPLIGSPEDLCCDLIQYYCHIRSALPCAVQKTFLPKSYSLLT